MFGKNQEVPTEIREPMKFQLLVNLWLDKLITELWIMVTSAWAHCEQVIM